MAVRSIHEGPALTLEVLTSISAEEDNLTQTIMRGWIAQPQAHALLGPPCPTVARLIDNIIGTLVFNGVVCPASGARLSSEGGRRVLGVALVLVMMEGAEVLRWHQLAQANPAIEEE